jgi:hypothetical protein
MVLNGARVVKVLNGARVVKVLNGARVVEDEARSCQETGV